jgi:hypothetical protein
MSYNTQKKQFTLQSLLVDEIIHGLVSLPFAGLVYIFTGSLLNSIIVIITTYSIDIDHLFDYLKYNFKFPRINEIVSGSYFHKSKKVYVLFHSWEWVIVFIMLTSIYGPNSIFLPISLGMIVHILYDSISYKNNPQFYSLIYRIQRNFAKPR